MMRKKKALVFIVLPCSVALALVCVVALRHQYYQWHLPLMVRMRNVSGYSTPGPEVWVFRSPKGLRPWTTLHKGKRVGVILPLQRYEQTEGIEFTSGTVSLSISYGPQGQFGVDYQVGKGTPEFLYVHVSRSEDELVVGQVAENPKDSFATSTSLSTYLGDSRELFTPGNRRISATQSEALASLVRALAGIRVPWVTTSEIGLDLSMNVKVDLCQRATDLPLSKKEENEYRERVELLRAQFLALPEIPRFPGRGTGYGRGTVEGR